MKRLLLGAVLTVLAAGTAADAAENRCGWLHNPTPANWWLNDADGSWTLMTQGGGEEPDGIDIIPDISAGDYVRSNGNYGYACACMSVDTDDADGRILAIHSFRQLPIAKCANDPALSPPD